MERAAYMELTVKMSTLRCCNEGAAVAYWLMCAARQQRCRADVLLHWFQGLSGRLRLPACRRLALAHMALDMHMPAPEGCRAAAGLPADEEDAVW